MPTGNSEGSEAGPSDSALNDLTSPEAAELAAAEAEARAQAARARAVELRRKLDEARGETSPPHDDADDADNADNESVPALTVSDATPPGVAARRRIPLPSLKAVATIVGILLIAGSLTVTGLMLWQHRKADYNRHNEAEYAAAARQGVVNLMTMDSNAAKETVQRLIDDSTGKFQANFKDSADDLIKAMQDAKVVTKVTVNDVAVDEIDDDTAVVLVAATSERTDAQAPKEDKQPRVWRVVLTVVRDGGQIKMSDVEFA